MPSFGMNFVPGCRKNAQSVIGGNKSDHLIRSVTIGPEQLDCFLFLISKAIA